MQEVGGDGARGIATRATARAVVLEWAQPANRRDRPLPVRRPGLRPPRRGRVRPRSCAATASPGAGCSSTIRRSARPTSPSSPCSASSSRWRTPEAPMPWGLILTDQRARPAVRPAAGASAGDRPTRPSAADGRSRADRRRSSWPPGPSGPRWAWIPLLASWLLIEGDPVARRSLQPATVVVLGGSLMGRSLRRDSRAVEVRPPPAGVRADRAGRHCARALRGCAPAMARSRTPRRSTCSTGIVDGQGRPRGSRRATAGRARGDLHPQPRPHRPRGRPAPGDGRSAVAVGAPPRRASSGGPLPAPHARGCGGARGCGIIQQRRRQHGAGRLRAAHRAARGRRGRRHAADADHRRGAGPHACTAGAGNRHGSWGSVRPGHALGSPTARPRARCDAPPGAGRCGWPSSTTTSSSARACGRSSRPRHPRTRRRSSTRGRRRRGASRVLRASSCSTSTSGPGRGRRDEHGRLPAAGIPVLLISAYDDAVAIRSGMHAGALGFVPKRVSYGALMEALSTVARGRAVPVGRPRGHARARRRTLPT